MKRVLILILLSGFVLSMVGCDLQSNNSSKNDIALSFPKEEFVISKAPKYTTDYDMSLSGEIVVWSGNSSDEEYEYGKEDEYNIYGKNLKTEEEFVICDDAKGQVHPIISGNGEVVLWKSGDINNSEYRVQGKNLKTGKEFVVSEKRMASPQISNDGKIVIWQSSFEGKTYYYVTNLETGEEFLIGERGQWPAREFCSAISDNGKVIAWVSGEKYDFTHGSYNVTVKNLKTGDEVVMSRPDSDKKNFVNMCPQLSANGKVLVWQHHIGYIGEPEEYIIMCKNFETGEEFVLAQVKAEDGRLYNPKISANGKVVAWNTSGEYGIVGKNLETGEEYNITEEDYKDFEISDDGSIVVWNYDGVSLKTGKTFTYRPHSDYDKSDEYLGYISSPKISSCGNFVIWADSRSAEGVLDEDYWEIYGRNISDLINQKDEE